MKLQPTVLGKNLGDRLNLGLVMKRNDEFELLMYAARFTSRVPGIAADVEAASM